MRAVNLIPAEERVATTGIPGRSEGAAYLVLVLLAGIALLAVLYGHAHRQIASKQGQLASLNARAQQKQAQASGLAAYTSFTSLRQEREHAVSELVDSRFDWAHSFHELGRVLPRTASISSIQGAVGSATASGSSSGGSARASTGLASATPPGSVPQFTLTGCATSQAQVALMLNRLRLMDGVSEVTLQNSTKSGSSASGPGAGSGQCPASAPTFTVGLTFAPMPAPGAARTASAIPASLGSTR
jgi:Tfp pilus assembly protein PilN